MYIYLDGVNATVMIIMMTMTNMMKKVKENLQYVDVVRRSMVSFFSFEFFFPIFALLYLFCLQKSYLYVD